jgi:hypothetical protein
MREKRAEGTRGGKEEEVVVEGEGLVFLVALMAPMKPL